MYLQEVFDQLANGELTQTNLGVITEDKWPVVVNHVNLGLSDLFKRFFLREGRLTLQLLAGQTSYPLDDKHAVASRRTRVPTDQRFIVDTTSAPFLNDVLKIERVHAAGGEEFVLNDDSDPWALTTTDTAPPTLRVPADVVGQSADLPDSLKTGTLEVVYWARHPKIDVSALGFSPDKYEVRLPDTHLQALLYYVASRVIGLLGTGQNEGISGASFFKHYEAECALLSGVGSQIDRTGGYDKLHDRGFA